MATTNAQPAPADPRDAQFDTAHLRADLKQRTVRGGAITLATQAARFALVVGSNAVLARLLSPDDFGLIAMVVVVTGFVELFKDAGLSQATVQRDHITHRQVSTLFWVNVALAGLAAGVVAGLAPIVAWWYEQPRLLPITLALAGTLVFGGLAVQHQALLRRSMRYGRLGQIELASQALGITAGIAGATLGLGPWALVVLLATTSLSTATLSFLASGWIPGRPGNLSDVRDLLGFGGNLVGFTLVNYAGRNADNFLIGRFVGATSLGLYSKAYTLLMLPLKQVNAPLAAAMLPALSRLQDQPSEFRRYYLRAVGGLALATLPLVALLAAISQEVVLVVLGDAWGEAGVIFRLLAIAAIFQPVLNTVGWVCTALGRTRRMLAWALMSVPIFIASFVVGLPWGAAGVAAAYAVAVNLLVLPGLWWNLKDSPIAVRDVVNAAAVPTVLAAFVFAAALTARMLCEGLDRASTALIATASAGVAGALLAALWPPLRRQVRDTLQLRDALRGRKPAPAEPSGNAAHVADDAAVVQVRGVHVPA